MKQYLDLGRELVAKFDKKRKFRQDRTKVGTVSVFGRQTRFDLQEGFPLVTTKKVFLRGIIEELLWILAGDTNNNTLVDKNVHIWDQWATETGDLGPIYGAQWRSWPNPRGTVVTVYTCRERFIMAKDMLEAGMAPFNSTQLDHLMRCYGLQEGVQPIEERAVTEKQKQIVQVVHEIFDSYGIPRSSTQLNPIDQIKYVRDGLLKRPYSRRHIVSAWNVADLPNEDIGPQDNVREGRASLASCHTLFQFYVEDLEIEERVAYAEKQLGRVFASSIDYNDDEQVARRSVELDQLGIPSKSLSCQLYQRSADFCLGVPFNIASYALLTMMMAQCVNMVPGEFIHTFGDLHVYSNHVEKLREQLTREPHALPTMWINPEVKDIFGFTIDDFKLQDYVSHEKIDFGGVAV